MIHDNAWDISRSGPAIVLTSEDITIILMVSWRQDGGSSAILARWEIEGLCTCTQLPEGDWDSYWQSFLDLVPDEWVAGVAHCESMVRS